MFFLLSKITYFFIAPFTWLLLSIGFWLFHKKSIWKKRAKWFSIAILLFFSNTFIFKEFIRLWEVPAVSIESVSKHEVGIVLGGMFEYDNDTERLSIRRGGDRIWQAINLYKEGKIEKILISGNHGYVTDRGLHESTQLKDVLVKWGIPKQDIIIETKSKNTYQNGAYWGTPTGWVAYAIHHSSPRLAKQLATEYIDELKENFDCEIGFSDHTMNSKAACTAIAKGIKFIEKHFTIDQSMDGFDHKYASNPKEFKTYVSDVRAIEMSLVKNVAEIVSGEDVTKVRARRGLYLKKSIKKGETIIEDNLIALRPSNNFNPYDKHKLIGVIAGEDINEFESISLNNSTAFRDSKLSWKEADKYWVNEMKEKKML
jgi:hypothetical protein